MWIVDLTGWKGNNMQLLFGAASAICLGLYAFTMPACPPTKTAKSTSIISSLGLDAFVLFKQKKMAIFFVFSMLLGAALQITNAFGGSFLGSFASTYPDSFVVKHEILTLSISQISETLFILAIPFFLRKFGIKQVMMMSIFAWVFRFGLFGLGNPGTGLPLLLLSMIVYGMAFDFFNISGSLFVEKEAPVSIRASAQGLFMFMTNGLGAYIGGKGSGLIVDFYTKTNEATKEIISRDWQSIWFVFAAYALVIGIIFPLVFKYKHKPEDLEPITH
jgi:NHS family xanthosine MFS transporter